MLKIVLFIFSMEEKLYLIVLFLMNQLIFLDVKPLKSIEISEFPLKNVIKFKKFVENDYITS